MVFIGLLFLLAATASAEIKIGYINSEEIFVKYRGTKDAQEKYDKEAAKTQQLVVDMQKEIKELESRLEKQSLLLSGERKKELEDKIKSKYSEYEQFVSENYGRDGKLIQKNVEMTKPIIQKINTIIEKIAVDENYDLILDGRMGGIVYAKKVYDLTARVLEILNKEP
jgi:outer membrane protein